MDLPTPKSATNLQWFTEDGPDPSPLPGIPGWKVLVRPVPNMPKSKGGIIIPDQTLDEIDFARSVGRVLVVGHLAYTREDMLTRRVWGANEFAAMQDSGPYYFEELKSGHFIAFYRNPWCAVGDFVVYRRFAGIKISYGGVRLLTLNDDEVQFVIEDPSKINE